jgi:hypothetical protein
VTVVLAEPGQPFYYAGRQKIYFEPDRHSFLVMPGDGGKREERQQPPDAAFVSVKLPGDLPVEEAGELMASVADELRQQDLLVTLALAVRRGEQGLQGLTPDRAPAGRGPRHPVRRQRHRRL